MAQVTAAEGTYWLNRGRRLLVTLALVIAIVLVMTLVGAIDGLSKGSEQAATSSPRTSIAQVDDFVTRKYLSAPTVATDSWKDDHLTRKYLPGE